MHGRPTFKQTLTYVHVQLTFTQLLMKIYKGNNVHPYYENFGNFQRITRIKHYFLIFFYTPWSVIW